MSRVTDNDAPAPMPKPSATPSPKPTLDTTKVKKFEKGFHGVKDEYGHDGTDAYDTGAHDDIMATTPAVPESIPAPSPDEDPSQDDEQ